MIGYDKEKGNNVIQAKFIKELLPGEMGMLKQNMEPMHPH
jgi:hypothetical protein